MDMSPIDTTPWRPRDLPPRTIETLTADLHARQAELSTAIADRHKADREVRRATEAGDLRNIGELNKAADRAGKLVTSLEAGVTFSKQRLAMAETQAATIKARAAPL